MDLHDSHNIHRCVAEGIGTFWLTFAGCGSAVIAAGFPEVGIGLLGVSLAFGLTRAHHGLRHRPHLGLPSQPGRDRRPGSRRTLPEAGHRCPTSSRRSSAPSSRPPSSIRSPAARPGFDLAKGFAANGYGEHSPGQYTLFSGLVAEVVLTMMFLFIIMGATHGKAPAGFAPIAIGLGLTLIHLVGIPITNTSVNPARSTGPALFVGGWALAQLWLFWVAPLIGGALGGILYRWLSEEPSALVTGMTPATPAE